MAYALFDNTPDTPDELSFRKGDILVVLDQNLSNIEGWWLCALNGNQGICPANRLRILPNVCDIPQKDLPLVDNPSFQRNNCGRFQQEQ
ncbi:hypothetical protein HHI36_018960 [Cryptolaemus montrouzieri]|uniref:SH3 domain-containing protein n=1 Tax=Cryptolaemus montrouzieri TaxID=559131 RepID=A0ABD2P1H9_9CUCU